MKSILKVHTTIAFHSDNSLDYLSKLYVVDLLLLNNTVS